MWLFLACTTICQDSFPPSKLLPSFSSSSQCKLTHLQIVQVTVIYSSTPPFFQNGASTLKKQESSFPKSALTLSRLLSHSSTPPSNRVISLQSGITNIATHIVFVSRVKETTHKISYLMTLVTLEKLYHFIFFLS